MRLLDRMGILRTLFARKDDAADAARRWSGAASAEPELVGDVIRLSGLLTLTPDEFDQGMPMGAPVDPVRLAVDRGRRDMARQLIALMGISNEELRQLMEDDE